MDTCVVCKSGRDTREPFWPRLTKCRVCGHVAAGLDTRDLDPHRLYGEDYFRGDQYGDYLGDRRVHERHFRERLKFVTRFVSSGDLIEIGCAYGFFLDVAREGFRARGYDIAEEPVAYARESLRVDARCEDFSAAPVAPASADVVVMWDVIEHLPRPDAMLLSAARALRPGGFLFLTTGDIGSVLARVRKGKWRLIQPPAHLHYFSKGTMRRMLGDAGLAVAAIRHVGVRRSLRQIAHGLSRGTPRWGSGLSRFIAGSRLGDISLVINTYDIMLVVARKPLRQ